ncbi:MAG: glycosyltransferase family 9 protein [Sphingomonadales bacterium]
MRFSALGDVAMTVPVVKELLQQNPSLHIVMVSNSHYAPLFASVERLTFLGADLDQAHRGFFGLLRLFWTLRKAGPYQGIVDLHNVIRTQVIRVLFFMTGASVYKIDKGRIQKRALTRRYNKQFQPLYSAFDRMQEVFFRTGLSCSLPPTSASAVSNVVFNKTVYTIGIAPFAKHPEKAYPLMQLAKLIALLGSDSRLTIQLYGGGGKEAEKLAQLEKSGKGVVSMAGRFTLSEELSLLRKLDLMISMDSANMHLASLCEVPVLSIWGPTHRFAGFMGWGQPEQNAIEVSLGCRPCSVFGNKPCYRGDHACMHQILPEQIVDRVYKVLRISSSLQES